MPDPSPDALPVVSVVLPTFNRSHFLEAAFGAVVGQTYAGWELIVVDDGSTDDTRARVEALAARVPQSVVYRHQANSGAYGARNTGVSMARGAYVAFYDSDDLWLPHHLASCVQAMEAHADVDWVYSASEIVDLATGRVLDANCFYQGGQPRPFMALTQEVRGALHVITSREAIRCQIDHGLYCGLQNSVLRRRVFDTLRFAADPRNEAEDQLFAIRAVAAGFRLAYFDDVHVRYQVHDENSSAPAADASLEKRRRVYAPLIEGYQRLPDEVTLSASERRALRRRLGKELFWHLGYAGHWAAGDRRGALALYGRALQTWPWDVRQWKTYALALVRAGLNRPADPTRGA